MVEDARPGGAGEEAPVVASASLDEVAVAVVVGEVAPSHPQHEWARPAAQRHSDAGLARGAELGVAEGSGHDLARQ